MNDFRAALMSHARLNSRMGFSRDLLQKVRDALAGRTTCGRSEICVYVAGSLGRLETGRVSDLDVFLFADRPAKERGERSLTKLEEIVALSELIQVNNELQLPPFSGDGRYFKIHEVCDLLAGTGTSTDDSENLFTTRLLLLLESKCISNDALYSEATQKIIEMYFRDGKGRKGYKPLFLLNDILRYWRTVCLNYERARTEPGKPWWKKNLNLKFSRKLTVFSTVLAIVVEHIDSYEAFGSIGELTPLERLAYALDKLAEPAFLQPFAQFLDDYEDFLAAKSHSELEQLDQALGEEYSAKAQRFDDFLHEVFASKKLNRQMVRYLLI